MFAEPLARAPLLGVYALMAEWQALMDPALERSVAQLKLAWWHEEIARLHADKPVHPICLYLARQPRAAAADFRRLLRCIEAAIAEVSGAPLERAADVTPHAEAVLAVPLQVAARLIDASADSADSWPALSRYATAEYLARAIRHYRHEAGFGRTPFAVDELLQAGIENTDLLAADAPPRLQGYLDDLRSRAAGCYADSAALLPAPARRNLRHLLVLAALGAKWNTAGIAQSMRLGDMLAAWRSARGAARFQ